MINQIVYVSTPDKNLKISEVELIVDKARVKNESKSVTGFLCANSSFFIQCLEGEKIVLDNLFELISKDSRHHNVKIIHEGDVKTRTFGCWGMGVVLRMEKHYDIMKRYSKEDEFDPYNLSADESMKMLIEFSRIRKIL